MREFRVQFFPAEQKGFKAAIKSIFGDKLGLKKGEELQVKIGRLTEHDYHCVDVLQKGNRVGEIRKSGIDEMIEKGAFEAAHYAGYMHEVPQITITCLETHEYRDKPEYKAWRAKLKKEAAVEKEARDSEFPNELKRMIAELFKISDPVKKHFQYQLIVDQTYQRRKDAEMRKACKDIGLKHISAFDAITPHLKKEFDNKLPQVLTFKYLPKSYLKMAIMIRL